MKKLLGIVVLGLLLSENAYTEIKIIERIGTMDLRKTIDPKAEAAFTMTRVCVDGLEFLVTGVGHHTSTVQVFETRAGSSLPKNC